MLLAYMCNVVMVGFILDSELNAFHYTEFRITDLIQCYDSVLGNTFGTSQWLLISTLSSRL